jgi:hypothetical protein
LKEENKALPLADLPALKGEAFGCEELAGEHKS